MNRLSDPPKPTNVSSCPADSTSTSSFSLLSSKSYIQEAERWKEQAIEYINNGDAILGYLAFTDAAAKFVIGTRVHLFFPKSEIRSFVKIQIRPQNYLFAVTKKDPEFKRCTFFTTNTKKSKSETNLADRKRNTEAFCITQMRRSKCATKFAKISKFSNCSNLRSRLALNKFKVR